MHLETAQSQILPTTCARIEFLDFFERNTKFIRISACGDLFVSARSNVGIHAHSYRGDFFQARSNLVNSLQFRFAFGIESVNTLLEGKLDFLSAFAHTCEGATMRITT